MECFDMDSIRGVDIYILQLINYTYISIAYSEHQKKLYLKKYIYTRINKLPLHSYLTLPRSYVPNKHDEN